MSDSISDVKDRNKGINPMSKDYIKKVDDKRRVLGFSLLSPSGEATSSDTMAFCMKIARSTYICES